MLSMIYFDEEGLTARLTAANEAEDIFNIELGSITRYFESRSIYTEFTNYNQVGLSVPSLLTFYLLLS